MIIGIPKEIKPGENRVSVTPFGVAELVQGGHAVIVEKGAGTGSGFSDEQYIQSGAELVAQHRDVFDRSELIVKVKEPLDSEVSLLRPEITLFTYLHLASSKSLTEGLIKSGCTAIAYETVEDVKGRLPLLFPMSQIAGRLAVQVGAYYLMHHLGGKGLLAGGVPGVDKGRVVIIGGGTVGTEAAKMASGIGAKVTILDVDQERLTYLSEMLPGNVQTLYSNSKNIEESVKKADLVIGAVLLPGAKAPILVPGSVIKQMEPGSVVVDVAVDQGGCVETSVITTHENPIHVVDGVLHYGVANMPGAVSRTSTLALTSVTLPYIKLLAQYGWRECAEKDAGFRHGINVVNGSVVYRQIADQFALPMGNIDEL